MSWLLPDHNYNQAEAEDKVGVYLYDEKIDRCVEGLYLDIEVYQYQGSEAVNH